MKQYFYKTALLLTLCILPLIASSCDTSDDIATIFTGHVWKLGHIYYDDYAKPIDLWGGNEEAKMASLELRDVPENFNIEFIGADINGQVSGTFNGRAAKSTVEGRWTANGSNKSLSLTNVKWTDNETDRLAQEFKVAIENAYKYSGDSNTLYIHYLVDGYERIMSLIVKR